MSEKLTKEELQSRIDEALAEIPAPAYSRGSIAEHAIRDAVVSYLHAHAPDARIVHELVVGGCRADVAAVFRDRLVLFEIKSERDVLKRLNEQVRQFCRAAHDVVVVAHQKFFDTAPYSNGRPRIVWTDNEAWPHPKPEVWAYPDPDWSPYGLHRWRMPRLHMRQPRAADLLELLWRDELAAECAKHHIAVNTRTPRHPMIEQMAWLMTGREIAEAVCRQLRHRPFPAADEPLKE